MDSVNNENSTDVIGGQPSGSTKWLTVTQRSSLDGQRSASTWWSTVEPPSGMAGDGAGREPHHEGLNLVGPALLGQPGTTSVRSSRNASWPVSATASGVMVEAFSKREALVTRAVSRCRRADSRVTGGRHSVRPSCPSAWRRMGVRNQALPRKRAGAAQSFVREGVGSRTVTQVPLPSLVSTSTRPPICSAASFVTASPRPVPS